MITDEDMAELMLLPLVTFGADPEVFKKPNWGTPDDGADPEDEE